MSHSADDRLMHAAALTFAMLRFEQRAAHERRGSSSHPLGQLGFDRFVFLPAWTSLPRDSVVDFLAHLPGPVFLFPTTSRGVTSLMLLDELSGDRRAWAQKTLDNQAAGVAEMASQYSLDESSRILLEVDEESLVFSLDTIGFWSQRFSAPVGWNIVKLESDSRASARFRLIASDGTGSHDVFLPGS
jgi:hypothetical protein